MYDKKRLASHFDDIIRALKDSEQDNFDEDEVNREFEQYLYTYQIPLNEAKRSVVRKFKGDPEKLSFGVDKPLGDIRLNEASVNILCRIITANKKTVEVSGKKKDIVYGLMGDHTTTIPYTAWTSEFKYKKGDVLYITNVTVKEWNHKPQVNINPSSVISTRDPEELPYYFGSYNPTKVLVKDIRPKMSNLMTTFRILSVEGKEISTKDGEKTVFNGIGADETGQIRFSSWHDFNLNPGEVVKIVGAYSKDFGGIPQIVFDERSKVEKEQDLDEETLPSVEALGYPIKFTVWELMKRGGALNVSLKGVMLDIKPGSGLIFRCPECARTLKKGACMLHGPQEGIPDLRIKGVLDDGTSACSLIIGKEITEQVLEMSLEEALALAKEKMNYEIIKDRLANRIIARSVMATGDVYSDEYGPHMMVKDLSMFQRDSREEAQRLLEEMEVAA
jgi:replication factor A1